MFLPESSTNTDNEVFQEPRGLNKLLWRKGEEVEMASLTYSWERESGSGIWCFFTLIKNRDALQWKKYDEKLSSHELKAGGGTTTNRQLLMNSTQSALLEKEKEGGVGWRRESTLLTKMESTHFSAVWKYGLHFMIQFPLPPLSPPSLTSLFPPPNALLFRSCSHGYKSLLKHRKTSKRDWKNSRREYLGSAREQNKYEKSKLDGE